MLSLPNGKVPGPDGYTKEFFVAVWPIVGRDLVIAIQSFFHFGFLLTGVNSTILALIPKKTPAQTMKDFRPIACCNLLYKVISKLLSNRLKKILPLAIEPNQCAFIKGRLLLENIYLANEVVKGYHLSSTTDHSTIKFDISKAIDTVKWGFIVSVLQAMGLPELFIHWIHLCVSTTSFSVAINGELEGFFTSARGIKQGCSLSPYLYVILNNVLSRLLNKAAADGVFGYHATCKTVRLTHLSFADDILVFTDGKNSSLDGVLSVMNTFAQMSGLHINASKSSIYSTGQNKLLLQQNTEVKGLTVGTLPFRYLGLPLTSKAWTRLDYEPLIDWIRNKFLAWSNRFLSFAGRLQLIKSVISSVVNFWCTAFILPKACLQEIESLCSAFLWPGSPNIHHKAKVAWGDLCLPTSEGGLGIRKVRETSKVFALGLVWKLFALLGSLWVAWVRVELLKNGSFWDVKETNKGFWLWKKLLKLRPQASEFMKCEVQSCTATYFWFDDWLGNGRIIDKTGELGITYLGIPRQDLVSDVCIDGEWRLRSHRRRVFGHVYEEIENAGKPVGGTGRDIILWRHNDNDYKDHFSTLRTWDQIRVREPAVPWCNLVWFP